MTKKPSGEAAYHGCVTSRYEPSRAVYTYGLLKVPGSVLLMTSAMIGRPIRVNQLTNVSPASNPLTKFYATEGWSSNSRPSA